MGTGNYITNLEDKMDLYVHYVYKVSSKFPREELYGSVSQLRRSALSVALNFIEGYARKRPAVKLNFWEISYGSLKESRYLLKFALVEKWIVEEECVTALKMADEIGAMLWKALTPLQVQ